MIRDKLWFCLWGGYVVQVMLIAYWVVSKLFGQLRPNESNFVREKWYQLWPSNQLNAQLTFWSRRRRASFLRPKSKNQECSPSKFSNLADHSKATPRSYPHCFLQVLSLNVHIHLITATIHFPMIHLQRDLQS